MDHDNLPDDQNHKKGRHRKKHLYNAILKQMEFYFSDSNLNKDRFLMQLVQTEPLIEVSIFLKFNKINKLTTNVEDIVKAVSNSELLQLSEDKSKVGRKLPVVTKENVDDCTLYVERLKPDATHESVTSIFSEFGDVVYVSIPKYKQNGNIKGFAFVEFETEEGCTSALQHFESIGCKISCAVQPDTLCSIATFESEPNKNKRKQDDAKDESSAKRVKITEDGGNENITNEVVETVKTENEIKESISHTKKRKIEEVENVGKENNEGESEAKKVKIKVTDDVKVETEKTKNESQEKAREVEDVEAQTADADCDSEDKKKKKIKKLSKRKFNLKELGLLVLSKKDWKKMRNRYLNMQRNTMKQLKMHLKQQRPPRYKERPEKQEAKKEEAPLEEFQSGIIVKVFLTEPCLDNKKLKGEIKSLSDEIKFIDIPLPTGSEELFIRFSNSEEAKGFCENSKFGQGKCSLLSGEEERVYMERINDSRLSKQKKNQIKQRGRDKLLKKAERQASIHIRFDDSDD